MNFFFNDMVTRFFDILLSAITLIVIFPILLIVMIILKFTGEGEIFYLQERIGKNQQQFNLIKFATMIKNSVQIGSGEITLANDSRVLPFGKFLRKTKINELPQLINILKGDLSVIGPRPQTQKYYDAFEDVDLQYISKVKPGLSGVGSIIFRDEESLLEDINNPVEFDLTVVTPYKGNIEHWFVVNRNIILYFQLIMLTTFVVIFPKYAKKFTEKLLKKLPEAPNELKKFLGE